MAEPLMVGEQDASFERRRKRARKLHAAVLGGGWLRKRYAACSGCPIISATLRELKGVPEDLRCRHPACGKRFKAAVEFAEDGADG